MSLYQSPEAYFSLFNQHYSNIHIDSLSFYASSKKIQELGGLSSLYSEVFVCTQKELEGYLNDVARIIDGASASLKEGVGILLSIPAHTVALFYKPDNGWRVNDINCPNAEIGKTAQLVAASILTLKDDPRSSYLAANITLLVTKNDPRAEVLKKRLAEFKKKHLDLINSDMAMRAKESHFVFIAAQYAHTDILAAVARDLFVDLNQTFRDGATPAYIAAQYGFVEVLKELLKHSCVELNKARSSGCTPAFIAAQNGHVLIIAELAEYPARVDLNQALHDGCTPAYIAANNGHAGIIAELARHPRVDLNKPFKNGATPAYIAARKGHVGVTVALARCRRVRLNDAVSDGSTPVYIAAENGHAAVVAEFMKYDSIRVDLNKARQGGSTPVYAAARNGHVAVLIEFAKQHPGRVNLNQARSNGSTALFVAAQNGHLEVINFLLDLGVDTEIACYASRASLNAFAMKGTPDRLLRMNKFLRTKQGDRVPVLPSDIAYVMGHEQVVQRFKAYEEDERYKAVQALFCEDKPPVRFFDRRRESDKTVDELASTIQQGL